jgi:hypothetical protein
LELDMVNSTLRSPLAAQLGDFLYAPIGEDNNATPLTVLSALARQNVDPWEEAADLSRLRGDAAMRKLTSMMAALPQGALADCEPNAVAARLLVLLPHSSAFDLSPRKAIGSVKAVHHSSAVTIILSIITYFALTFLTQWLIASVQRSTPIDKAIAPTAVSAPSTTHTPNDGPP